MLTFMDMNVGPEYPFYYKIAQTKITLWICVMLGPCMPVLYFVGAIAFIVQYIIDRLSLAYFYRLPPMYSERLTLNVVKTLKYYPCVALCIAFWLYTNK